MILTYIDCLPSLKLMSYFTSFEETELVDFGPQDLFNWREPVFSKPGCHVPSMAVLPCPFPFGLVEVRLWSITCGWCFSWNLTDVFVCKQLTSSTSAKCYSTKSCQWDRGPVLSTMFATFSMDLSMLSLKNVTTQPVTASYSLISHSEYSGPRLCDGFGWSDLCHGFGIFEPETL